jgi:hypothetical protein
MRVLPRFPATISATNGLTVERPVGTPNLIVKPDFGSLVQIPNVGDGDNVFFMAWDRILGLYRIMSFSDLFEGVADLGFMQESVYDPQGKHADAFARANQTGVQAISTVTGLQTALDSKADAAATTAALATKAPKSSYAVKSGNYTAVAADAGATLRFTAAATLSLTAAATLANGWPLSVVADGGVVTIDPNGSETINGLATLIVPNGSSAEIICDGSNFFTVIKPTGWELIGIYDFTGLGTSGQIVQNLGGYRDLRIGVDYDGAGVGMSMQLSADNGSTFLTSAVYARMEVTGTQLPSSAVAAGVGSDTALLFGTVSPQAGMTLFSGFELRRFNKAFNKTANGFWHSNNAAAGNATSKLGYVITSAVAYNAFKFFPSSGTVNGRLVLEGIRG